MGAQLLLIEDHPETASLIANTLRAAPERFGVTGVRTGFAAMRHLAAQPVDCVLLDYLLPDRDGLGCLREIRRRHRHVPVIMITGAGSEEVAVEAMKLGARDYVPKVGLYLSTIPRAVRAALGECALKRATTGASNGEEGVEAISIDRELREKYRRLGIIGASSALDSVLRMAQRAAHSSAAVLLQGESGTGKERLAQAIHELGPRANGPFTALNCAALPESLLESELFGHVRGAFTGADRDRRGLFEEASGGTLFLDEVTEIGPSAQAKLLRVLQEREVRPLGSGRSKKVDVRVIAATNQIFSQPTPETGIRPDLYYRLSVIPISLPPLRERREDVPLLAEHFLRAIEARDGKRVAGFEVETLELLRRYGWPGNVRELQNEVERLVLMADPGTRIPPAMLADPITESVREGLAEAEIPLRAIIRQVELATVERRLRSHGYNRQSTARSLGISREALWAKLRQLGIVPPERKRRSANERDED